MPLETVELYQGTLLVLAVGLGVKGESTQEANRERYTTIKIFFGHMEDALFRKLVLTLFCERPGIFEFLQFYEAENEAFVQEDVHLGVDQVGAGLILVLGLVSVDFENVLLNGGYGLRELTVSQQFLNFMYLALIDLELRLELSFVLNISDSTLALKFIVLDLHDCASGSHGVILFLGFWHQDVSLWLSLVFLGENIKLFFVVLLEVFGELDCVIIRVQVLRRLLNDR